MISRERPLRTEEPSTFQPNLSALNPSQPAGGSEKDQGERAQASSTSSKPRPGALRVALPFDLKDIGDGSAAPKGADSKTISITLPPTDYQSLELHEGGLDL